MTYYAIRWSIKNGVASHNERTGDRPTMERQFHLYCASCATNADGNQYDAVEWGTIEGGKLDRKVWQNNIVPVETEGE